MSLDQTSTYLNTSAGGLPDSQRRSDEKRRETPSMASALRLKGYPPSTRL
jgi:hypothetical protein